ncbi:MAG TPA: 7-cyano-7-deazaguanine synthase QueC [Epsilonproteobacteria bacterium]|nr:7-cyano-7-deazaguanine synthase QueC [Campylobacterota bacterium]
MKRKAVCVISGGMDSAVSAKIAQNEGFEVIGVHFNYLQRTEKKELEAFYEIVKALGIADTYVIDLPFFAQIGASALTDYDIDVPISGLGNDVPITYVPFRNGIFLSIATSIAEKEGAEVIYIGVVEADGSGYPDCTKSYITQMEYAINQGTKAVTKISIKTPLIMMSKKDIVKKAIELEVPLQATWSCYKNETVACGVCDSCRLRLRGFKEAEFDDFIPYESTISTQ